jgi:choline-sulfatase
MSRPVLIAPECVLAAPVVALAASAPAALRVSGHLGFFEPWLVVAGLFCVPVLLLVAAARLARRSLEELLPSSRSALFLGVGLWAIFSWPAYAVLGALLQATTHHRGLGGATFGALAFGASTAAALLAWRLSVSLAKGRPEGAASGARNAILTVAVVMVTAFDARSAPGFAAGLDGLLVVALAILASSWDGRGWRRASLATLGGATAVAAMVAIGAALLARSPDLGRQLGDQVPLAGAVGQTIGVSASGG